ncbi:MAG: VCBS repeat-containing protein [Bryobacteraceae bacterium]
MADCDRDGYIDLFVCQYGPAGGASMAKYLRQPTPDHDASDGPTNQLFRNNSNGTFSNFGAAAGLGRDHRWSFAASWADFDGDGYPDLCVANDFGPNDLCGNNGSGTFCGRRSRSVQGTMKHGDCSSGSDDPVLSGFVGSGPAVASVLSAKWLDR